MWRNNESGMMMADTLLSLMVLFMLTASVLPFCFSYMTETKAQWERQEGMRKLFEKASSRSAEQPFFDETIKEEGFHGRVYWMDQSGKVVACVETAAKRTCVEQY